MIISSKLPCCCVLKRLIRFRKPLIVILMVILSLFQAVLVFGAIDFIQKGMHKAWGLKQLLNHWDLNEANIMAFGDGDNGIELLRMASHSYAMENASPALLQVADQVAPHHKDQGVLTILEDYLGLY